MSSDAHTRISTQPKHIDVIVYTAMAKNHC